MGVDRRGPEPPAYYYFRSAIFRKSEKLPFLTNFRIFWGANPTIDFFPVALPWGAGGLLSPGILKSKIYFREKKLLGGTRDHPQFGPNVQKFAGG